MTYQLQTSFRGEDQGLLYLVPTPIGNMQDMTFRAVEVLRSVDTLLSEDTRNTQKLLNHFDIKQHQESFHEHNAQSKLPGLIARLQVGETMAQVSDAGMPSISDPGHDLVLAALAANIKVVALPGASAGITGLIASGIVPQPHVFYGFLPRKKGAQQAFFTDKRDYPETQIFYESPHRVKDTLRVMLAIYGDRKITLVRELTKIYEEYRRGRLTEVLASLEEKPLKGECLLIVSGQDQVADSLPDQNPLIQVEGLIQSGYKPNQAIKEVAKHHGLARQALYQAYHEGKQLPEDEDEYN